MTVAFDDDETQVEDWPATVLETNSEPVGKAASSQYVSLLVCSRDEDCPPSRFRIKRTQCLKKLMKTYCNLRNFPFEKSRFYFLETLTVVLDSDTPQSEGMDDNNTIYHVTSYMTQDGR